MWWVKYQRTEQLLLKYRNQKQSPQVSWREWRSPSLDELCTFMQWMPQRHPARLWSNCVPRHRYEGLIHKSGHLILQFSSVQSLSHVWLFATPWIAARQASLSITNSRSSLRLTSIQSVMPSSHFILCRPLLLLPPIPPSIRVFPNESTLRMRWPKYWSFSFSIIPSKEIPGLISFRVDWLHHC